MASSTSTVQIINAAFSFFQLFAKFTCTYFQHHKKLLQADIHVCTATCESHGCRKQEFLTLLNHLSSWACVWILCGMCVKDKDYSICDGKYTVGWLKENRRNGEKLSEQKRTRKSPHMCGLTVSHSDQIPLLLASGQPWSFLQVSFNTQAMTQGLSTGVNKELNVFGLRLTLTFSGR